MVDKGHGMRLSEQINKEKNLSHERLAESSDAFLFLNVYLTKMRFFKGVSTLPEWLAGNVNPFIAGVFEGFL